MKKRFKINDIIRCIKPLEGQTEPRYKYGQILRVTKDRQKLYNSNKEHYELIGPENVGESYGR